MTGTVKAANTRTSQEETNVIDVIVRKHQIVNLIITQLHLKQFQLVKNKVMEVAIMELIVILIIVV